MLSEIGMSILSIVYLILVIGVIKFLWVDRKRHHALLLILILGLFLDNFVIAIGIILGEGTLLLYLNLLRFGVHAIFTPFACLVAYYQVTEFKILDTTKRTASYATLSLYLVFVVIGSAQLVGVTYIPELFDGTLRYVTVESIGPPFGAIGTIFYVLAIAILMSRNHSHWLLVGSVIMILGAAIPTSIYGPLPQSIAEVIFALGFFMNAQSLSIVKEVV
ncbi:MAG: hypothetical protein ACFFED_05870 [Candidatus Thorarchaeota archaeon]